MADELGITPARVSQVIGLLRLAPCIQEYVRGLGPEATQKGITEAALRPIAVLREYPAQETAFWSLLLRLGLPARLGGDGKPSQAM